MWDSGLKPSGRKALVILALALQDGRVTQALFTKPDIVEFMPGTDDVNVGKHIV